MRFRCFANGTVLVVTAVMTACGQPPSSPTSTRWPVLRTPTPIPTISSSQFATLTVTPTLTTAGVPVAYTIRVEQIPDGDAVQAVRVSLGQRDEATISVTGGGLSSGSTVTLQGGSITLMVTGQYVVTATISLRSGTQLVANAVLRSTNTTERPTFSPPRARSMFRAG